jgi:Transposase DDE domain
MASLQKRARLLAFRLFAPYWILPEALCSQSQFNRRVRALAPEVRAFHYHLARELAEPWAAYHVLDTTLIPAIVRVRASRKGLFLGQATFGRSASKTEWV